ncbi:hypothetical protein ACJZ2D_006731 [Fusarium nematophilum]
MAPADAATAPVGSSDSGLEQQSIESLPNQHREIFTRAVSNALSSPISELTYAQIIDGSPLSNVAMDAYEGLVCPGHPLVEVHQELSDGVLDKAREIRSNFDATAINSI